MPLKTGRPTRALPGPSIMPDAVLRAMHRAAPDIYGDELIDLTASLFVDLKKVARTDAEVAILIGNGHAAWEAALVNTLAPGDKALVLVTGRFGLAWAEMARKLGIEIEMLTFPPDRAADPDTLETRLRADTGHEIKSVLAVQTDTATSAHNDIAALRAALDAAGHPALLQIDCIASFACAPFEMDRWGVDVMVAASQKGLMTPPGLSFVFVSPRAIARRRELERVSAYFDLLPRLNPDIYYQYFCGTPPTHHLYGLRAALNIIIAEGMEAVWARHRALAEMVWSAVEVWGETGAFRLNIPAVEQRSPAVTTVHTGAGEGDRLRAWCRDNANVVLGVGLGLGGATAPAEGALFRIGHMGYVNLPTIMGLIGTIDAGLKALDIPHGGGALRVASEVAARHAGRD